jgi:hypothetical protein
VPLGKEFCGAILRPRDQGFRAAGGDGAGLAVPPSIRRRLGLVVDWTPRGAALPGRPSTAVRNLEGVDIAAVFFFLLASFVDMIRFVSMSEASADFAAIASKMSSG